MDILWPPFGYSSEKKVSRRSETVVMTVVGAESENATLGLRTTLVRQVATGVLRFDLKCYRLRSRIQTTELPDLPYPLILIDLRAGRCCEWTRNYRWRRLREPAKSQLVITLLNYRILLLDYGISGYGRSTVLT